MNSAEILFEAYDLLPVPDEREFLIKMFKRAAPWILSDAIGEVLSVDEMERLKEYIDGEIDIKKIIAPSCKRAA